MNPIVYALNQLRHEIPEDILRLAFSAKSIIQPTTRWHQPNPAVSIDQMIKEKIIHGRVNIDCNLNGGSRIAIDLRGIPHEQYDLSTRVWRIPYEKTGGRRIVSIMSVNYMRYHGMSGYNGRGMGGDQLLAAAMDMYNSIASMPIVATAHCQLVGENVVMVKDDVQHLSDQLGLTCMVENDEEMNNLNPGIHKLYARLVTLATKAYIYTNTDISMDRGVLHAGVSLGRIREIVDGFADANELYEEVFDQQWRKASFTNDRNRMQDFIRSQIGRGS